MSEIIWIAIGLITILLIVGLLGIYPEPRLMRTRFARLIYENATLGDRLCELFYGIVMVSVMIGIINISASGYIHIQQVLLLVAFGVNIVWGIIDGATSVYGGLVDRAEEDRIVNSLRKEKQNQQLRDELKESLGDTAARKLSDEDQSKVVDMIQAGTPEEIGKYGASVDDVKSFLATFLMDFITVFPVIIPLYVISGVKSAVFWSHFIAVLLFVMIGTIWAKRLNKNVVLAGIAFCILGMAIIAFAYYFGW